MVNHCWNLFKWACVLAVCGTLALAVWLFHRFNDEIRLQVEARLAEQYPHLVVSVRGAQLIEGQGISVRGLSILDPQARGPQAELLHIDELFLTCPTDWQSLLSGKLKAAQVVARAPTLRATRRADGTWSVSRLSPLPNFGGEMPTVLVENGVLEIFDPHKPSPSTLTLRGGQLKLTPQTGSGDRTRQPMRIEGQFAGDHLRQGEIQLTFDPDGDEWLASGTFEGLEFTRELIAALPGELSGQLAAMNNVRATINGSFTFEPTTDAEAPLAFDVRGQVVRGRIDDPRLPYPITDLNAAFQANQNELQLNHFVGRHGQAMVRARLERTGYTATSPTWLSIRVERLSLDRKLTDILPPEALGQWHKYLPSGEIDLDVRLAFDGRQWSPEVTVRLLNTAFSYHRFPYRLERGAGSLTLKQNVLAVDVLAYTHTEPVRIVGQLRFDADEPYGEVEIRGQNIRVDEKLLVALEPDQRNVLRAFNPYGTFNLLARFWRQPGDDRIHRQIHLGLNRCSLRFEKFPYPLDDIRGMLELDDDNWTFHNLEGRNDTGRLAGQGTYVAAPGGGELRLRLVGSNVQLEEEMCEALAPGARQMWRDLKPRGAIDLETEFHYHLGTHQQTVWVRATPVEGSVSIEPTYFPYRFDNLQGTFIYQDGRVLLQNLRARHGNTTLSAQAIGALRPDGGWELRAERLAVDRLAVDRDLIQAVPERMRKLLADLRPTGLFNLRGGVGLASSSVAGEPITADWNVDVFFMGNSLRCGLELDQLHGSLTLAGGFNGQRTESAGELRLDSVLYQNVQFTDVLGPFWIDNQQVLIGFWADRQRGVQPERRLTARLFGGTVVSDAWVALEAEPRYALQFTLSQASLGQMAQEVAPGTKNVRGDIYAQLDLRGTGASQHGLAGKGNVQLRNADVYELPVMVQLLKLLSVRQPDATGFTDSDIDLRIEGEHVYIDRINFNGDAISLRGLGEMNFNTELRLMFYAVVGRDRWQVPVISDLLGGASQQIMQIHVDGTLANPIIRREAFPVVNQALQQLQAELAPPQTGAATRGPTLALPAPSSRK